MRTNSEIHHIAAKNVVPLMLSQDGVKAYKQLEKLGICFDARDLRNMAKAYGQGYAQDADLIAPLTTQSITSPIQFLQSWLPGFVANITEARTIDELVGITTQGSWEDEEIVQGVLELTGNAQPYGDYTNIPLSSWNANWERRTIVRFEEGMRIGRLEEKRAAKINANDAEWKRIACSESLEIMRNRVGFNGYNNGDNRTYGLLNDPNLPAYINAPNGAGGNPEWSTKTYLEIVADIRVGFVALRASSGGQINPKKTPIKLAIAMTSIDYLSVTSEFGNSVLQWLETNYPNVTVESVPEFDGANGGANVYYMYAESVDAGKSSDDKRTFVQVVPAKFQTLGVEQGAKGYAEDHTNATAGVMCKRPYAVYRFSGI